ncbi:MAG TPA: cell division protein FtsX [Leucothrix mucor]|uniref:Cell division protein FtsX n=1 Tax=Leucothrix mucor TaxID=45248 RepID=A0A7V2WVX6_LEUMU|nr:cell division protein FtsX [Leucothrix mucor]
MATSSSQETSTHQATTPTLSSIGQHKTAFKYSLKQLWQTPLSTWITLAAIAIALSLPAGLHLLLLNLKTLTDDKREIPTISLFMQQNITEQQAKDRAELLSDLNEIDHVLVVTRDDALEKFKQLTGFAETLETLKENPLPHVLVITPRMRLINNPEVDLAKLARQLELYSDVDVVQMDIEWVQRLLAILHIADRSVLVISFLLALTVLLVVGNTIRLNIENRKEEIEVTKLIGATNAYIRRPFLYGGIWYGLFGGILSLVIVHFSLLFLISPVNDLARLYGSHFTISGLDVTATLFILAISSVLGLLGAQLAVGKHLRQIAV